MYDEKVKGFVEISQAAGSSPDMVQGGGGNTSVKLDNELMAVKASGYRLNQITHTEGFVVVNYKNIKRYYENVDLNQDKDYEKDSVDFVGKNVVEMEGLKKLRPSVEAGFHSILEYTYIMHTHPVYANILCCSEEGEELAEKIFGSNDMPFLWVPYINPGFSLTLRISEGIRKMSDESGRYPEVILMENHGLIVGGNDSKKCIEKHLQVINLIKTFFGIKDPYPEVKIIQTGDKTYASGTKYLLEFFKENAMTEEYFDKVVLYPDQLVYLNGAVSIDGQGKKLNINTKNGELVYTTSYQEALTMDEAMLAYIYVINKIKENGLTLKTMNKTGINFISSWESEKYRKSVIKS